MQAIENKALVLGLIEWIGAQRRPYDEVMAAWRTSCPRLPVGEDALESGFVACERGPSILMVSVTPAGRDFLLAERPSPA